MKPINLRKLMKLYEDAGSYARQIQACGNNSTRLSILKNEYDECCEKLHIASSEVNNAIAKVQGRAKERCIYGCDIVICLREIERKLDITKKAMNGIEVNVDYHAQVFPRSYKYRAMSTIFKAVFRNGSWWLTDIERTDCRRSPRYIVKHTETSAKAIIDKFSRLF